MMPKKKYSPELKAQVLAEYEETKDAKLVAAKHGILPKQVWQWKAVENFQEKAGENASLIHYFIDNSGDLSQFVSDYLSSDSLD